VWREKGGWSGPHKLIAIDGQTCTIQMPHGPTQFRSTVVKPYYSEEEPVQEVLEENHDQPALEGESDSDTIVVDTP